MPDRKTAVPDQNGRALFSWAVFDWGNSAHPTVILTFVFSAYFTRQVAPDEIVGSQVWGIAIGLAGLFVALLGPALGAATDQTGGRKPWISLFVVLCVVATALLWFVEPSVDYLWRGAILAAIGAFAIEMAIIFYNAMLPDLAARERIGRWSGWGWGLGYAGGLVCLVVVLFMFVEPSTRLSFLSTDSAEHIRGSFLFVAAWVAVFTLPLLLFTPDSARTGKGLVQGVRDGIVQLRQSFSHLRDYGHIVRFLIAHLFYVDGLATAFAFGGVYAAGTFGMDEREILLFAIALNVTAGLGAFSFSWVDDHLGSRRTILIALVGLIVAGVAMLLADSVQAFWIAGLVLGIFVGPAQAASRSYLAHAAPPELQNQMFGLFAFSGKATAFVGPLLVGSITAATGSQRAGMSTIVVFFIVGGLILLTVPRARDVL